MSAEPSGCGPGRSLVDDCVHCGFCLPTCPTYLLTGDEAESPRGRILLMKQDAAGAELTPTVAGHFDSCLGCLACVSACPSGVRYDRLIEATRISVEQRHPRNRRERLLRAVIFTLFPYPRRLRPLLGPLRLYQRSGLDRLVRRVLTRLSPTLAAMESLAPPLGPAVPLPTLVPALGQRRARVGMLTGCVQRSFFPGVNAATTRVLAAEGCEVLIPAAQGCCGSLSLHVGREEEAKRFARALIDTFVPAGTGPTVDFLVVNVAGCGAGIKEYAELLAGDPGYAARAAELTERTRDVSELLAELGPVAPRHPLPLSVAYHDACHLANAQRIKVQPRQLLTGVPGLKLREITEADICCGSAGVYNLLQPVPARELGDRKASHVAATGADLMVTANPGCLLQIRAALERAGTPMRVAHVVEVLDAAISGRPL